MIYICDDEAVDNRDKLRNLYKMVKQNRKQAMEDLQRIFREIDLAYIELEEETRVALKFAERNTRPYKAKVVL